MIKVSIGWQILSRWQLPGQENFAAEKKGRNRPSIHRLLLLLLLCMRSNWLRRFVAFLWVGGPSAGCRPFIGRGQQSHWKRNKCVCANKDRLELWRSRWLTVCHSNGPGRLSLSLLALQQTAAWLHTEISIKSRWQFFNQKRPGLMKKWIEPPWTKDRHDHSNLQSWLLSASHSSPRWALLYGSIWRWIPIFLTWQKQRPKVLCSIHLAPPPPTLLLDPGGIVNFPLN